MVLTLGAKCITTEDVTLQSKCSNKFLNIENDGKVQTSDNFQKITISSDIRYIATGRLRLLLYSKEAQKFLCFNAHWGLVGLDEIPADRSRCQFYEKMIQGYMQYQSVVNETKTIGFSKNGKQIKHQKRNKTCFLYFKCNSKCMEQYLGNSSNYNSKTIIKNTGNKSKNDTTSLTLRRNNINNKNNQRQKQHPHRHHHGLNGNKGNGNGNNNGNSQKSINNRKQLNNNNNNIINNNNTNQQQSQLNPNKQNKKKKRKNLKKNLFKQPNSKERESLITLSPPSTNEQNFKNISRRSNNENFLNYRQKTNNLNRNRQNFKTDDEVNLNFIRKLIFPTKKSNILKSYDKNNSRNSDEGAPIKMRHSHKHDNLRKKDTLTQIIDRY
jgi:hypothetical protein